MAPTKPPYDPIVSVEGMYKGSLTRLGYFFKDPTLYGEATLAVLRETAKRYDDALDDCLIQILDAKWLLEHQLAQNQARRAHEAAEVEKASNKRKLESTTIGGSASAQEQQQEENPAKRVKIKHGSGGLAPLPDQDHGGPTKDAVKPVPAQFSPAQENGEDAAKAPKPDATPVKETGQNADQLTVKDNTQPAVVPDEKKNTTAEHPQEKLAAAPQAEPKQQQEQADLTANDEDMNFESMFGDANAGNDQSNDLNFDLSLDPDSLAGSNPFDATAHDANNLELLPGLESYANATGDDFSMLNLPPASTAKQPVVRAQDNNFDLPEIQGDSNFNDLFADGDFGGDASLMDLDLEDGFFNT